jgi:hypothetical protein
MVIHHNKGDAYPAENVNNWKFYVGTSRDYVRE